jgi:hypothetical protein
MTVMTRLRAFFVLPLTNIVQSVVFVIIFIVRTERVVVVLETAPHQLLFRFVSVEKNARVQLLKSMLVVAAVDHDVIHTRSDDKHRQRDGDRVHQPRFKSVAKTCPGHSNWLNRSGLGRFVRQKSEINLNCHFIRHADDVSLFQKPVNELQLNKLNIKLN